MSYVFNAGRVSTNVSIDRINSKIGYTQNNIQLVCMAVNQMKNDLSNEELFDFCKNILNYNNGWDKN